MLATTLAALAALDISRGLIGDDGERWPAAAAGGSGVMDGSTAPIFEPSNFTVNGKMGSAGSAMRYATCVGGCACGFILGKMVIQHQGSVDALLRSAIADDGALDDQALLAKDFDEEWLVALLSLLIGTGGFAHGIARGWTKRSRSTETGRSFEDILSKNFLLLFGIGTAGAGSSGSAASARLVLKLALWALPMSFVAVQAMWAWLEPGAEGGGRFGASPDDDTKKRGGHGKKKRRSDVQR